LYTPDTSRVAIPAIFCTTPSAIDVLPCDDTSSVLDDLGLTFAVVAGVPDWDTVELVIRTSLEEGARREPPSATTNGWTRHISDPHVHVHTSL
jgi:hypothetical protein